MTSWIIIITLINLLSLAIVLYLLWLRKKQQRLIKQLELVRLRIARDLHDDIGATLSSISFYSDAVKQRIEADKLDAALQIIDKMGNQSKRMIDAMNDIVWMVNPKNDGTEKLLERLEDYGKGLFSSKEIKFICQFDSEVLQSKFWLDWRRDFYLICKEGMNNAAKYSESKTVEFLVNKKGQNLEVVLRDNGIGFNVADKLKTSNGLLNMKVRAERIGANFSIKSELDKGTCIQLNMSYPPNWV
jgi:signal transduction histidine kinase